MSYGLVLIFLLPAASVSGDTLRGALADGGAIRHV